MKGNFNKNKDKDTQFYDVGSMGILAGGYAGIMLFLNNSNIIELILGITGIVLGVVLIFQMKTPYTHRQKNIRDLKYLLIAAYAVFIFIFISSPQLMPEKLLALTSAFLINSVVIYIIHQVQKRFT